VGVHPSERPGEIKLVGESQLIADLLDRKVGRIQQLDGPLHAKMV
jgi:hypothetical protein